LVEGAYLVIDVGTGGIKSIAFDMQGHPLYKALSPIDFLFEGSSIGFDAQASWARICRMIREAVRFSSKKGKRILAVSSTSMREGNVFYDDRGTELLAVPNIDGRAGVEAKEIAGRFGDLIYEKSGHWPMPMFLVCRLKWLRKNEPELFRKTAHVSMINDWVLYRLSGQLFSEPTNGCETAAFDLRTRNWSDEIVSELGIDSSILPPVKECGTILGKVEGKVCKATGLDPTTDVVLGAADTEAALVGCGAFDPGSVASVAGTTTPVQAATDMVKNDPTRRTWSCCHAVPGRWIVESNAGATGLVFDWWSRIVQTGYSDRKSVV
jgi:autoinducer 2 (AI-2) kinase